LQELQLDFTVHADEFIVKVPDTMAAIPILAKCRDHISSFQVLQGTMDDAFIGITGRELRQ
jgi:multidrug/hemolysin transport system ATP-binding protein